MEAQRAAIDIVMADDDPDDRMLTREAMQADRVANRLHFVSDGAELMDFLMHRGKYTDATQFPRPGLILLDLNMPRMDGREALAKIKSDPKLRSIPVVILTTSKAEEDIIRSYETGANSFITKPVTFEGLVEAMRGLQKYWFEIVDLPVGALNPESGQSQSARSAQ